MRQYRAKKTLTPYLDLSRGFESKMSVFTDVARELGRSATDGERAFKAGMAAQGQFKDQLRAKGAELLKEIEQDPEAMGVVLFGRPYNSFAGEANKGIPGKFASRGYRVIPFDMLPL